MFKCVNGKASFANIQDLKGSIQILTKLCVTQSEKICMQPSKKSDIGDIWGVKG